MRISEWQMAVSEWRMADSEWRIANVADNECWVASIHPVTLNLTSSDPFTLHSSLTLSPFHLVIFTSSKILRDPHRLIGFIAYQPTLTLNFFGKTL